MRQIHRCGIGLVAISLALVPYTAVAALEHDEQVAALRESTAVLKGTWRAMTPAPFSSAHAASAWLDDALVVVDIATARAASYDPEQLGHLVRRTPRRALPRPLPEQPPTAAGIRVRSDQRGLLRT